MTKNSAWRDANEALFDLDQKRIKIVHDGVTTKLSLALTKNSAWRGANEALIDLDQKFPKIVSDGVPMKLYLT